MIQPYELTLDLPMEIANGVISTTQDVWQVLHATYHGDLNRVKEMAHKTPALIYAQYNYAPPIYFAVREGHVSLVKYLLAHGAYDPKYKTYPFLDSLEDLADERGHAEIASMLEVYADDSALQKFAGDNGRIHFKHTELELEFESAVDRNDLTRTKQILESHPMFARDQTFFWGEGILAVPAKENHHEMIQLLMRYGAKVPDVLKWPQAYYFEKDEGAETMMRSGMSPNVMNWNRLSLLHHMAQCGDIFKAKLLIDHGATIDLIDDEYQSTPLGLAARFGTIEMVKHLISHGADVGKAGKSWATPLEWARKRRHSEIEELLRAAGA